MKNLIEYINEAVSSVVWEIHSVYGNSISGKDAEKLEGFKGTANEILSFIADWYPGKAKGNVEYAKRNVTIEHDVDSEDDFKLSIEWPAMNLLIKTEKKISSANELHKLIEKEWGSAVKAVE